MRILNIFRNRRKENPFERYSRFKLTYFHSDGFFEDIVGFVDQFLLKTIEIIFFSSYLFYVV